MRPLTRKEKQLLSVLLALLFIFANVIGLPWLNRQQKLLATRITSLKGENEAAQIWLKDKALWTERLTWLNASQPKFTSESDASSSFLETLQQSAKQNEIKIIDQKLLEPEKHSGYQAVAVHMSVSGNLKSIVKWLTTIQEPTLFQAVLRFNLKIEGEAPKEGEVPNMRCELDMARWYAPSS